MGVAPPAFFFACLADFFSFGVSKGFFFVSLFDFWTLATVYSPAHVDGSLPGRSKQSCTAGRRDAFRV
jgi:hypothetical protein